MHPSALISFQLRSAIDDRPLTVRPDTSVMAAVRQMNGIEAPTHLALSSSVDLLNDSSARSSLRQRIPTSCVLIVEADRVVGILTDRDIVRLVAQPIDLANLVIRDVMNHPVITLDRDEFTDLSVAIDLLTQHRIRHLPVVDRYGGLIGLLTRESLQQRSHPNQLWREQIAKLEQELAERQIAQAQLERTNQQLSVSNQDLARSTELKDEFLTSMSHELRTPLNAILGMAEGIQEGIFGEVTSGQIQAVKTIEDSSNHLLSLINDILDIAKIGANQIELEYAMTDIRELCYASLSFVKQQAIKKQIRLQIQLPPRLPQISMDERRMRQVLINLLNNAVKFTPVGGHIALNISIESDNTNSSSIRFAVIDTGIGINRADLTKLFQPFMQIDSALNRQYNGTGLGLALVKGIVEKHNGSVQVRSEIGVGSQFFVDLPIPYSEGDLTNNLLPQLLQSAEDLSNSFDESTIETMSGELQKILLVEDNEANIKSISSFLKAKGYQMILAKNGLEAINLAKSQLPDLILMDIQMPKMDGLEAIEHIRQHPQLINVPIVALTALAMSGDREKCLTAGANEYLTKPVKLKQLSTIIYEFLGENN